MEMATNVQQIGISGARCCLFLAHVRGDNDNTPIATASAVSLQLTSERSRKGLCLAVYTHTAWKLVDAVNVSNVDDIIRCQRKKIAESRHFINRFIIVLLWIKK